MELIPIFFGILFFLACCIAGLVYSIKVRGRRRWGGLLIAGIGLIGLLPILAVSPPINLSLSGLSGTYQGDFGDYQNTLKLNKDGSFDQQMVDDTGSVHKNHGTWKLDQIQSGSVDFDHILLTPMETWDDPNSKSQKLETTSFSGAAVHALDGGIYFSEDTDLCVKRVSK